MPALSMFYGIIVRMQSEKGGKHHKPHIHALYGDDEIVIAIDGEILEGHFPTRQLKCSKAGWPSMRTNCWPTGRCSQMVRAISRSIL